ncbi:hypothetical protein MTO96_000962 [Rhipicephalus appendiculatus]
MPEEQRAEQDLDCVVRSRRVGSYVFCEHFPEEILRGALAYRHRPGEVYIVTYPKCGTTWMQHILYHVYRLGQPPPSVEHFFRSMPFLERHGVEAVVGLPFPGSAVKTHMLYDEDRICPEAKYIYVVRNPLDCCVSFYHHYKLYPIYQFERGTFDEFFELFFAGDVDGGDYFDHLSSWYEDLKKDTKSWILALADFLGAEYGDALRSDPDALAKAELMAYTPRHRLPRWAQLYLDHSGHRATSKPAEGASVVRKGVVGDWKNHFTSEQVQRLKDRAALKFKDIDIMSLWKDCLKL